MKKTIIAVVLPFLLLTGCASTGAGDPAAPGFLREVAREFLQASLACGIQSELDPAVDFKDCVRSALTARIEPRLRELFSEFLSGVDLGDGVLADLAGQLPAWVIGCALDGSLSSSCVETQVRVWATANSIELVDELVALIDRLFGTTPTTPVQSLGPGGDDIAALAALLPYWAVECSGVDRCIVKRANSWVMAQGANPALVGAVRKVLEP